MDARDEILKYLLEKKDNRRMIDITELVKSLGLEPIQLRSVLSEIQSEHLAEIDSCVTVGNIIGEYNNLGNKTTINEVKHEIGLDDIIKISARINIAGEKLLTHGYNMKIENVNIKAENVAFGEFNKTKINQSSSENKKSLIQKAINTIKKIVQNSFIALIVSYVAKYFK